MTVTSRLAAQLLLVATIVSVLALTWSRAPAPGAAGGAPTFAVEAIRGMNVIEGQIVLVAAVIGIALAQVGLRPAWMAAGFIVAVAGRELSWLINDDHVQAGVGLWLVVATAVAATALLVRDMIANMSRAST